MGERRSGRALAACRLRECADALLAVLLAPACLSCRRPLDAPLAGPMCPACWEAIPPLPASSCPCCGEPAEPSSIEPAEPSSGGLKATLSGEPERAVPGGLTGDAVCFRCRHRRPLVQRTAAAGRYDGPLRDAIQALKYDGRRSLARPLAGLMRERGGQVLAGADAVVPVPLHPSRRRQRGFNQARDLACGLGLPVLAALRRTRATDPQADLPAETRLANVTGAFTATRRSRRCRGAVLVLVDDVATTGATLEACAAALLAAGVGEVRAITAARAVKSRR